MKGEEVLLQYLYVLVAVRDILQMKKNFVMEEGEEVLLQYLCALLEVRDTFQTKKREEILFSVSLRFGCR